MKNRIPPPVLTLVLAGLMVLLNRQVSFDHTAGRGLRILAAVIFVAGITILVMSAFRFKQKKTTVNPFRPENTQAIVADGLYRFSRNPMYLGMIMVLISVALYFANPVLISLIIVFYIYMTWFQIKPEERALTDKFGEEYTDYMKRVRRWI